VAGTVGALDNSFGVVGVAPGARLWKIKVLGDNGSGLNSWIICGLDMVTAYANDQGDGFGDIEVANVSIGGGGFDTDCRIALSDAYHQAYCRAVAAGVTVVVAAGNDAVNASGAVPAAYDEVITVSALADSDGQPGGVGPLTSGGPDDSLADFSNFGFDVDIAAPGVDIQSTMPGGGYGFKNGTSMASPHVAGAAALYLARSPGASPAQVRSYLLAKREQIALPNDFDGFNEGILNVADAPVVAPPPTVSPAPAGTHKNRKNRKKRAKGGKRGKR
jgi:subtilisin family serine protease